MPEWTIIFTEPGSDHELAWRRQPAKDAALSEAAHLHHKQKKVIVRIEGPGGVRVPDSQVMAAIRTYTP